LEHGSRNVDSVGRGLGSFAKVLDSLVSE